MPDVKRLDYVPPDNPEDIRYPSVNDAHMRLAKTVVRINDEPAMCYEVLPDMYGQFHCPLSNVVYSAHCNDRRIDISSAPLGFLSLPKTAMYLMRGTNNSQKQGLNPQSLFVRYCGEGHTARGLAAHDSKIMRALARTIMNDFPPLEKILESDVKAGAFSRFFAVTETRDPKVSLVHRKFKTIGYFMHTDKCFLLTEDGYRSRDRLFNVLSKQTTGGQYNVQKLPG